MVSVPTEIEFRLPPVSTSAIHRTLAETVDWGLAAYGIPQHWRATCGEGIRVAVLDTGIDSTHPDLRGAVHASRDFTGSRWGARDRNGHGTHVAGTLAARQDQRGVVGVAPACRLLVGKVLGDSGIGQSRHIAAGIDWAVNAGADILSLSLGSPRSDARIAQAIGRAVDQGRYVICAAGNEGRADSVSFPARLTNVVAVGAVNRHGRLADFSSQGDEVDICAPGEDILSTWPGGYARLSGTSMATPFVSGVVALLLARHRGRPGRTPLNNQGQLLDHLQRTARDAGPAGMDPQYGYGLIDPASLLNLVSTAAC